MLLAMLPAAAVLLLEMLVLGCLEVVVVALRVQGPQAALLLHWQLEVARAVAAEVPGLRPHAAVLLLL